MTHGSGRENWKKCEHLNSQHPSEIMHKNIRLIAWLNFCNDFRIYNAITVLYFAQVTGSFALALGVFSVGKIASAIFELPTGLLSDLVGRRMTVVLGQAASALAVFCYAIGGSLALLVIGAILQGLSVALFSGNNSALLYDSLKEEGQEAHFSEHEGKTSSMFQIALGVSALVGSIALGFESFHFLFWLSVLPQIIGFILAFQLVEPRRHYEVVEANIFSHLNSALKKFKENSKLRTLSVAQIFGYGIGESMHEFSPAFFTTLWPAWAIALARVFNHLFAAVGYRISGKLVAKFGELRVLMWGNSTSFIVGTSIIAYPTILTPLIAAIISVDHGTGSVARSSLMQREFSDEQRATMGSLNSLAGSLFFAITSVVLGLWADIVGPTYALLTAQLLSGIVIILYWRLFKKHE